ncbi:hypothetical protein CLAFUW4_12445 [Fulvia fulva]|uniref:Uncharacterized protein n=1 Tax=Passalora fulva TaxID=5499 RepID=A0A9Q8PDU3_PASFU|nr:uncharacterized protein CLAFUR5_11473 [Fulvia fulva]KAK4617582.1 hypothetical protein CLAFUR4_12450 [Fulvia fulva]KAK4619116.1 hypothetical protein CLAFUR0_12461 [Fulvia fulva]UJO20615.1 hypothetical protein CLAFUR5_11473 [Fulvia fulva]WPV17964.1 hypothetical protein CLAFUW4_12445 [Fulvia fulva]WPV33297.1 hypothetical protein CLAFUW7_12452 [Fulvia fulva]
MKTTTLSMILLGLFTAVQAGQNCKCQDGNGQYNDLTEQCCKLHACGSGAAGTSSHYPGPNHQCSAEGTNCLDSGAFVQCCQMLGVGGAYCWN